jgi:phosphopantetheinyl transferase
MSWTHRRRKPYQGGRPVVDSGGATGTLWLADPGEVAAVLVSGSGTPLHAEDLAAENRKHLEIDRQLIRTSRWLARAAVARRAGIPAPDLVLARQQSGRPHVSAPPEATDIVYSVSHSGGLIAVLEGRYESAGVDVERVDPTTDVTELGQVVMGPAEQFALGHVAPDHRSLEFFRHWVVKEAVLKALGTGFRTDPADVLVEMVGERVHADVAPRALELLAITSRPQWVIEVNAIGARHVCATAVQWRGTGAAPEISNGDWHELLFRG